MAELPKTQLSITLHSMDDLSSQVMVDTLLAHSDLTLTPPDEYDFADNTVGCHRYIDGEWRPAGRRTPCCDAWFIWIDGYALNHRAMGFANDLEFYGAMQDFFRHNLANGNVGAMYNSPQAERNTLKDFLAELDSETYQVIPSYVIRDFDHLADMFKAEGPLVVKPCWGGLRHGIAKVTNQRELLFLRGQDLGGRVAQRFYSGPEKRLWIADGRCPQGGVHYGKSTPWSDFAPDYRAVAHDSLPADEVAADVANAERLAARAGLRFGSVDFIGDRINEINGAGTGYVMWNLNKQVVVDARPLLRDEVLNMLGAIP